MLGSRSRLTNEADLLIENGALTLRAVKRPPREGWAEASRNPENPCPPRAAEALAVRRGG